MPKLTDITTNMLAKQMKHLVWMLSSFVPFACFAQGIYITSGTNLVTNGNASLIVNNGGFSNAGTFVPSTGTVVFAGTAAPAVTVIGGTSSLSFYNLSFNKSAGSAKLARNISVTNTVLMQQGNLDLATFNLDLGTTGSISGESVSAAITGASGGTILRTVNLNAPSAVAPGNMGIEITSSSNLGLTLIKRGNQQQISSSGYSINRYFEITPTNNSSLNATIKFSYLDAELATINENELKLWSSSNSGATWALLGADAQDATANYVLKNGISQLNRYTLASSVTNPLPVQFLSFNGQVVNNNIILNWTTGLELNNHHFEVEKSIDGRSFASVSRIPSAAAVNGSSYQSTDINAFSNSNVLYYRIKQVNNDGSYSYSKVVAFNKNVFDDKLIAVYPNPSNGPLHVRFTTGGTKPVVLQVIDNKGNLVASKQLTVQVGFNEVTYDISRLAQGVYILRLLGVDEGGMSILKQ